MIVDAFCHSPWLPLIAQTTLCMAAGLAASYVLRHRPARAHQVLLTALLASVLTPATYALVKHFGFGMLGSEPIPASRRIAEPAVSFDALVPDLAEIETSHAEPVEMVPIPVQTPAAPISWSMICLGGWLSLTAILLARLALQFALGLRLSRTARPVENEHLHRALGSAKARMEVNRSVEIRCSERIKSPILWCWTRHPVLLVHAGAMDRQGSTDWTGVFCHELAHLRRRDHLHGLLAELLAALCPWHPLLWWIRSRLATLSEQACDDWALAGRQDGADYAETLLGLAAQRQMAFIPTVIGKDKTMSTRIRRIIKDRCGDPRIGARWTACVALLAVLAVVTVGFAQQRPVERQEQEMEMRGPQERREAAPDWQREVLHRKLDELVRQVHEKETILRENRDMPPEERRMQKFELDLLREMIGQLERRLQSIGSREHQMPTPEGIGRETEEEFRRIVQEQHRRAEEQEARRNDLARLLDNLVRRAQEIEQQLRSPDPGQPDKTRRLEMELDRTRMQIRETEQSLRQLARERTESAPRPEARARRRTVMADPYGGMYDGPYAEGSRPGAYGGGRPEGRIMRLFQLEHADPARVRDVIQPLLGESGQASPDERTGSIMVTTTPENLERIERVIRGLDVPVGSGDLRNEVEDLRHQMNDLREQLRQMHKLLEPTGAREQTDGTERRQDNTQEYRIER